jgi:GT2 family glycosyltransferase
VGTIKKAMPSATIIQNQNNLGFGAANNKGIQAANTPFVLLLNPDCIPTKELYDLLYQATLEFPDAAIIAPQIIRKNGELEISYRSPKTAWKSFGGPTDGPCCVGFASGAALLLNKEVMNSIGYFDENFFLYYEDEDLCQRVFNAKKELIIYPEAKVTHLSRGSVKGTAPLSYEYLRGYHHAQSKLLFESKHFSQSSRNALKYKTLSLALLNLVVRLLYPQPKYLARLWGRIRGLLDATT